MKELVVIKNTVDMFEFYSLRVLESNSLRLEAEIRKEYVKLSARVMSENTERTFKVTYLLFSVKSISHSRPRLFKECSG